MAAQDVWVPIEDGRCQGARLRVMELLLLPCSFRESLERALKPHCHVECQCCQLCRVRISYRCSGLERIQKAFFSSVRIANSRVILVRKTEQQRTAGRHDEIARSRSMGSRQTPSYRGSRRRWAKKGRSAFANIGDGSLSY